MDIETDRITLSLTIEAIHRLKAFTAARNGSIHNQADAAIRAGIDTLVESSPQPFKDAYARSLSPKPGDEKP